MDEGNGTEYNEELQNNLDQNNEGREKDDIGKKACLERRVSFNKKFHVEKGNQRNDCSYDSFHINEWHLDDCLECFSFK